MPLEKRAGLHAGSTHWPVGIEGSLVYLSYNLRLNNLIWRQYCALENLLLGDLRKTRLQEFLDNMGTELGN